MRGALLAATPGLLLTGCGCSETGLQGNTDARTETEADGIVCFEPADGATLTATDDLSPTTPGIQITVRCEVTGSYNCEIAELTVYDDDAAASRTYIIPTDGLDTFEFNPVSLNPSSFTFQVVCSPGEAESNVIHIEVG